MIFFLFILIFNHFCINSIYTLKCLNEQNKEVDWWIFYKLPKLASDGLFNDGYNYLYITSQTINNREWTTSNNKIDSNSSIMGSTLNQIYLNHFKINYIQYNDEVPLRPDLLSNKHGHAKGVLAYDINDGFWIVHSIPNFPYSFNTSYNYPLSSVKNAQSAICISFLTEKDLTKIIKQLLIIQPNIYDYNIIDETKINDIKKLIKKEWAKINENNLIINSLNNDFLSLVKSPTFESEIYLDQLSSYLKTNFTVQTWRNGNGKNLESDCSKNYSIHNVDKIKLSIKNYYIYNTSLNNNHKSYLTRLFSRIFDFGKDKYQKLQLSWEYTKDHSKWAISESEENPFFCIGDLNRMISQKKRGGGLLCKKNINLWNIYWNILEATEACKINNLN